MHKKFFILSLILIFHLCSSFDLLAQDSTLLENQLTISYDISTKSDNNKPGIEETYNGGNKTIFISGNNTRIRLVSLMRIQSIFFFPVNAKGKNISIVKESGKQKYKYYLTGDEWLSSNKKYDSLVCTFVEDSLKILDYNCKKAIVTLEDGKELTVYYTSLLKPVSALIEPAFKHIPGLVLQYSYSMHNGSITYTASKISEGVIEPSIFKVPVKGYVTKSYCKSCPSNKIVAYN